MNTIAALIVLNGYVATARRVVHARIAGDDPEAGISHILEVIIISLGGLALAVAAVAVVTVAVNRRLDQIN